MSYSPPRPFTQEVVEQIVTRSSPGTYLLGRIDSSDVFVARECGRDDIDIRAHLEMRARARVLLDGFFRFAYWSSASEAFHEECRLFHLESGSVTFRGIHPVSTTPFDVCGVDGCYATFPPSDPAALDRLRRDLVRVCNRVLRQLEADRSPLGYALRTQAWAILTMLAEWVHDPPSAWQASELLGKVSELRRWTADHAGREAG